MFAATGNLGSSIIAAPARWSETVAVGATNNLDARWGSSNFGAETDLVAPGVSVWSLSSDGGYTLKTGTSMATPHACGAAALLWSHAPSLSRDEIRGYLEAGAKDLGAAGTDTLYGKGRVDVAASLALIPPAFSPEDLNRDGAVDAQDLALLLGSWGPCADCDGGCPADLDGDCAVGAADLARVLDAW
jgi:subtilisin family serine protease